MNVLNTFAITAIDEHRDTKYPTALIDIIEVGDFNHSGGYCYELLFFSYTCLPCFFLSLFIYDRTDVYHKANMPFTYAYLTFTL